MNGAKINLTNATEVLINQKINLKLLRYGCPAFISTLKRLGGSRDFAEEQFRSLGRKIGFYVGQRWDKKYKNIKDLVKDTFKSFGSKKFEIKSSKDKFIIMDRDCMLCWHLIDTSDVPFCVIISGYVEGFLESFSKKTSLIYPKATTQTIQSRSTGDDICKHEVRFATNNGGL